MKENGIRLFENNYFGKNGLSMASKPTPVGYAYVGFLFVRFYN